MLTELQIQAKAIEFANKYNDIDNPWEEVYEDFKALFLMYRYTREDAAGVARVAWGLGNRYDHGCDIDMYDMDEIIRLGTQ